MKQNNLPFELGEHYEKWEFELEVLDKERIIGYESYKYFTETKFLYITSLYTELIFNWDLLFAVIIKIHESSYDDLKVQLVLKFGTGEINNFEKYAYTLFNDGKIRILLIRITKKSQSFILYTDKIEIINPLLISLLC